MYKISLTTKPTFFSPWVKEYSDTSFPAFRFPLNKLTRPKYKSLVLLCDLKNYNFFLKFKVSKLIEHMNCVFGEFRILL